MFDADATILREVSRKYWFRLPDNSLIWVRLKATSGKLLRFIIERNKLAANPAELILRLPFEVGTITYSPAEIKALMCMASPPFRRKDAHFAATRKGIRAYVQ